MTILIHFSGITRIRKVLEKVLFSISSLSVRFTTLSVVVGIRGRIIIYESIIITIFTSSLRLTLNITSTVFHITYYMIMLNLR